jgi:hypothetical protein
MPLLKKTMRNLLRNLGLAFMGVLVVPSSGGISPCGPAYSSSADASRLNAEERLGVGTAWQDVKTFGAQGDGLADDTATIQKAINAARTAGSIVCFPPGTYVVSQLTLPEGISLEGSGMNISPHGIQTYLQQKAGTDLDLIVSGQLALGYHHWSKISNMTLKGAAGTTLSSGINIAPTTGEGFKLEHLMVRNFAVDGVRLQNGGVPFYAEDLHLFFNGWGSGTGYGIEINSGTSNFRAQTHVLTMISGDDNQSGLIHLNGSYGAGTHETYLIDGVKSERNNAGRMNNVIVIDNMNGAPVTILSVGAEDNLPPPDVANSVIEIASGTVNLAWFGVNADVAGGPGGSYFGSYPYLVRDVASGKDFANKPGNMAGTWDPAGYGSFNPVSIDTKQLTLGSLSTAGSGSHFGQAKANGDLAGKISIAGSASGSHTFSSPFSSAPVCTAAPASDPGKTTWWVTTTASAVTVSLSTPARITFTYQCFGNPD